MSLPTGRLPPGIRVFERGWLSSNNILLVGAETATLVDSGYVTHSPLTVDLVERSLSGQPLTLLVNTHLHSDHCGGNASLQAVYPSLETLVPAGSAEAVTRWDEVALTYQPTGQACPRFRHSGVLHAGSALKLGAREWQVHAAPGHDPHSVILYEPMSRSLISADALWEHGFGVVFPELEGESAFDDVAATLALIEQLNPAVVVPGHGAVFTDVPAALARARSRLKAFRADPRRHAAHAGKVLLKFKLLDARQLQFPELLAWTNSTPYFHTVHSRWFNEQQFQQWIAQLVEELVHANALTRRMDLIADL